jgi:hypothetical protein
MKVGDLVRWLDGEPEDDDIGFVIAVYEIKHGHSVEVYWTREMEQYSYPPDHPHLEVLSESR